ncbi:hypothetical protein FO488_15755 [Geobacter sp. FeAm09]|uniref:hypothetical protein n=1 Tax=Geobacter sp. FeAm09 TaxID=2597769 RepID=UPI0011EE5228|nr:hypothetical protein [Geobacter sp. FeAm09]QEM69467.1 hypothetical protein FO488_15755 [Geobacter sp. FeAm09]
MRRLRFIPVLAAAIMACSEGSVLGGGEGGSPGGGEKESGPAKDECLLLAVKCGNGFDTLQQRIERLQNEIAKGRAVYTVDELRILRQKLDNARKTLEFFRYDGAGTRYGFPGG